MLVRMLTLSGSEFSHSANSAAASGFFEPFSTTFAEPPAHVAETFSPAVHWGIAPTAHDPAVSGAVPRRIASAHEPEIHVTMLPFWMSAFHSLEKSASILTR